MAGSGPWSVKGIDPKARAAAKEAAQRHGMTLGEWLSNKMLEPDSGFAAPASLNRTNSPAGKNLSSLSVLSSDPISAERPAAGDYSASGNDHLLTEIEILTSRLEAMEHRSTLAITGIDQTVLGLRALLEGVEGGQRDVAKQLESSLQSFESRLSQSNKMTEDLAVKLSRELKDTARRIDTIGEQSDTHASKLRHEVGKDVELINNRSDEISQRLAQAEKQTDAAIRTLEASFVSIDSRLKQVEKSISENSDEGLSKKFEDQFSVISRELVRVVAETRGQLAAQIEAQAANPRLDQMDDALREMREKFANTESRHANTLEQIAVAVSKLGGAVESRLQESEERSEGRLRELQNEQAQALDSVGQSMADVVQRLESRFDKIDKAEQEKALENELEERLRASEARTGQLVEEALQRVHDRLDKNAKDKDSELSPVQQALQKLTDRLTAIEERSTPPFANMQGDGSSGHDGNADTDPATGFSETEITNHPGELVAPPDADPDAGYVDVSGGFDQPPLPPLDGAGVSDMYPEHGADDFLYGGAESATIAGATADHDFISSARRSVLQASQAPQSPGYPTGPLAPEAADVPGAAADGGNKKLLVAASVFAILAIGAAASVAMIDFGNGSGSMPQQFAAQQPEARYYQPDPVLDGNITESEPISPVIAEPEAEVNTPVKIAEVKTPPPPEPQLPKSNIASVAEPVKTAHSVSPSVSPVAKQKPAKSSVNDDSSFVRNGIEPENIYKPEVQRASNPVSVPQRSPRIEQAVVQDPEAPISLVRTNTKTSRPSLQQAAQAGDPIAQYQYAVSLVDSGQAALGASFMKQAAERGLPAAQYQLAKYYENGTGLAVDENEARRWTERSANGGNRRAMHNLAMFYAEGRTVTQSYETAAKWFEEAALLGLANSQFNLALLYEQGLGVPRSLPDAYAWYSIAGKAGDRGAAQKMKELQQELPEQAISEAKTITARFQPRPLDLEANGVFRNVNWARPQIGDPTSVSRAQVLLARMGYDPGPADGALGEKTRLAVIAYEKDNGLAGTGRIDQALLSKLERDVIN